MWTALHESAADHPKVFSLAQELGICDAQAFGHITSFWCWVLRFALDGNVTSFNSRHISRGAKWDGDPDLFVRSMVKCGLIDQTDSGLLVHDWDSYQQDTKSTDRVRKCREKKAQILQTIKQCNVSETFQKQNETQMKHDETFLKRFTPLHETLCNVSETPTEQNSTEQYITKHNNTEHEDLKTNTIVEQAPPIAVEPETNSKESVSVLQVVSHYRKYHQHSFPNPKSNSKEWRAIKARLGEGYTVEQLCRAIDGCHVSPFHCGENNSGKKYQSLELIMRDASKVTGFIEVSDQHASGNTLVLSEKIRRGARACDNWIRMKEAQFAEQERQAERA